MLNEVLADVVHVVHWLVVAFLLYAPFSSQPALWVMGGTCLVFIMSHWAMPGPHQDTCALTLAERWLRGCDSRDSFFHNIVSPIYRLVSPEGALGGDFTGRLVWIVTAALAIACAVRIALNWPKVKAAFSYRCG